MDYEEDILINDHYPKFKHVLKDIKEGRKIILLCSEIRDTFWFDWSEFWFNFLLQRNWVVQPLEGAALYLGRKGIVCSKQVPSLGKPWYRERHPYYQTKFDQCSGRTQPTRQEDKLINFQYFHR